MADEEIKPKTVTMSHKQLGVGGGILGALVIISQLKAQFVPTEKAQYQDLQIAELKLDVSSLKSDLTDKINRGNDKIIDRIKESEARSFSVFDTASRRMDALEAVILKTKKNGG